MERKIYKELNQRSGQWLNLRRGRITGTKFSKLMDSKLAKGGFGKTSHDVFEKIILERVSRINENNKITQEMRIGQDTEDLARSIRLNDYEIFDEDVGFITYGEYLGSSPDGIIFDQFSNPVELVEVKTFSRKSINWLKVARIDNISDLKREFKEFYYQIAFNCYISGCKVAYLHFLSAVDITNDNGELITPTESNVINHIIKFDISDEVFQEIANELHTIESYINEFKSEKYAKFFRLKNLSPVSEKIEDDNWGF